MSIFSPLYQSAALHVPARDALFVGDAIATLNVLSGATGPQIDEVANQD